MDRLLTASTLLAALGSGLIAGAFFAFSAFVLAGAGAPARALRRRRHAIDHRRHQESRCS